MEKLNLPAGTQEVEIDGQNWITTRLAAIRYGISRLRMPKWSQFGCPALDGRRLARRQFRMRSRPTWFYLESELETIATARATDIHVIEDDHGRWLSQHTVVCRLAISTSVIERWRKKGWPLPGGGLFFPRERQELVWGIDGRQQRFNRWFYLEEDIEFVERRRQNALSYSENPNWLTCHEAAREFSVSESRIEDWATDGYRNCRKVRRKQFLVCMRTWVPRPVWKYFKPDLARVAKYRQRRAVEKEEIRRLLRDGLSTKEVARRTGWPISTVCSISKAC